MNLCGRGVLCNVAVLGVVVEQVKVFGTRLYGTIYGEEVAAVVDLAVGELVDGFGEEAGTLGAEEV